MEEHLWISKKISISLFLIASFLYLIEKLKVKFKPNKLLIISSLIILYFPIILANFYRFNSTFSSNLMLSGNTKLFSNIAGINHLENSLIKLKKCKNIPILLFYRNSNFINSSQHYLSLGKYPVKKKDIYYPSYSANILAQKSFFYEPNGRVFKKKSKFKEHYKRHEIFEIIHSDLNDLNKDINKIEKKINFPFLVILGDNLNSQSTQTFFVNQNLISNVDLNCYKNL